MTICINFQNLTHLFWTTIIALNIYVIWLLYGVAKQYRLNRSKKMEVLHKLKKTVELKRQKFILETEKA